jgi:uncharacterized membrane protein (DUF2068 family)
MKGNGTDSKGHDKWLTAIAVFKWFKALLLIAVGIGFLKLMHHDIEAYAEHVLDQFQIDSDNRYIGALLVKLNLLDAKKMQALCGISFAYSGLFLIEGTGLFFEKRWAEYLTIVATLSLVPVEIYELIKGFSVLKCATLVINLAIAAFLVVKVRGGRRNDV